MLVAEGRLYFVYEPNVLRLHIAIGDHAPAAVLSFRMRNLTDLIERNCRILRKTGLLPASILPCVCGRASCESKFGRAELKSTAVSAATSENIGLLVCNSWLRRS